MKSMLRGLFAAALETPQDFHVKEGVVRRAAPIDEPCTSRFVATAKC